MKFGRDDYDNGEKLAQLPADMPVFLLLAQDMDAPDAVEVYARRRENRNAEERGDDFTDEVTCSARRQAASMRAWQFANGSQRADLGDAPAPVRFMLVGCAGDAWDGRLVAVVGEEDGGRGLRARLADDSTFRFGVRSYPFTALDPVEEESPTESDPPSQYDFDRRAAAELARRFHEVFTQFSKASVSPIVPPRYEETTPLYRSALLATFFQLLEDARNERMEWQRAYRLAEAERMRASLSEPQEVGRFVTFPPAPQGWGKLVKLGDEEKGGES